jgi:hypothetical protein
MANQQSGEIPFVARGHRDIVVITRVENSSLLTSVDVSSFNASLIELRTMLVTLCFQKVNCTSPPGISVSSSELEQLYGDDIVRRGSRRLSLKQRVMLRRKLFFQHDRGTVLCSQLGIFGKPFQKLRCVLS